MKVVFTICSNNYLAQAKALGDSLLRYNPEYKFLIGLVDKLSNEIDYSTLQPHQIIPIEDIGIAEFEDMFLRYDITELNTAVKPFIFNYIFKNDPTVKFIIYLDPDIIVFEKFNVLEDSFSDKSIILTPHFFTPIYDLHKLAEADILNAGLYNLGFLGLKRSAESDKLLEWWMIKLKDQCLIDFKNGLFVDQLWINFAPLYFDNVHILRDQGHNVAYWNLHEREISELNGKNYVNRSTPLVFFHFSGYQFNSPDTVSKHQNRFSFENRKDILNLFRDYHETVMSNGYNNFFHIECYYLALKKRIEKQEEYALILTKEGVSKKMVRILKSRTKYLFKNFLT